MIEHLDGGRRVALLSPTELPKAGAFLYNREMLLQLNCRGFASAQFMQPEPAKYAQGPALEAATFMQPEQGYYAHHPGRFFYLQDQDSTERASLPYEPVRRPHQSFRFEAEPEGVRWRIETLDLACTLSVSLPEHGAVELWQLSLKNTTDRPRRLRLVPYFPIGNRSWMAQSARFEPALHAVVAHCVPPYQKLSQYPAVKAAKALTYLVSDHRPDRWETRQQAFEGEGGLTHPDGLAGEGLGQGTALYEVPAAALQFDLTLAPGASVTHRFAFGPAADLDEIAAVRRHFLSEPGQFEASAQSHRAFSDGGAGALAVTTPEPKLDGFLNHWLPRQVHYHGVLNRMSTDPQTRNYLQDHQGLNYLQAGAGREPLLKALSQQAPSGAMPDGIRLSAEAQLKYINQVPHTDHGIWLPLALKAYLDESDDYPLLAVPVPFDGGAPAPVAAHLERALLWHLSQRDARGLCFIGQGDWCDPMNMVGPEGRGVSGWLTLALAVACRQWAQVLEAADTTLGLGIELGPEQWRAWAETLNGAVNRELWDGQWYARGITDGGRRFGVAEETEGRIYLNPQSWALMSGAAQGPRKEALMAAVSAQLATPHGLQMLAPAYTRMQEDIGRLCQKFPGSAENGSVYNHAAMFYIHALYQQGEADGAFAELCRLIPALETERATRQGQLPLYLPNYYRGAFEHHPEAAGQSSQLFNTGTAAWCLRIVTEQLFGLKGGRDGLEIAPQLPSHWAEAWAVRQFRGAEVRVHYRREAGQRAMTVLREDAPLAAPCLAVQAGECVELTVLLPEVEG
ncbi:GH36-type glycosyl hydrolase domain-containing protein [Ferrimonas balearica]|uniref:GH36-type glycosyl hydrolase domain-containing protein n=1 Tax=Ferrimonas balearica TaxID=44012 RepID=UPI001C999971|nr:hypothetical protein [Ferrimonas balearica]MBY5992857.1 hypothetical protein [Ferrimonas balearica]